MHIGNHEVIYKKDQEKWVVGDLYLGPNGVLFNLKLSHHIYVTYLELNILNIYFL